MSKFFDKSNRGFYFVVDRDTPKHSECMWVIERETEARQPCWGPVRCRSAGFTGAGTFGSVVGRKDGVGGLHTGTALGQITTQTGRGHTRAFTIGEMLYGSRVVETHGMIDLG